MNLGLRFLELGHDPVLEVQSSLAKWNGLVRNLQGDAWGQTVPRWTPKSTYLQLLLNLRESSVEHLLPVQES